MSYIKFDKTQLINLEFSLNRETIRSNKAGSYASTTIIGCNTRKYHGLLVCPIEHFDNEKFLFLSSLDETIVEHDSEFNLGINKYGGDNYFPKGHKYVRDFEVGAVPKTVFRVGSVVLTKESLLIEKEEQLLINYTLAEAQSTTLIRLRPFLAFRNIHTLMGANMDANTKVDLVENGIRTKLYTGFPYLYLQLSKKNEFIPFPDWYYGVEYLEEQKRGYDFKEDLFVPGYFEVSLKKGESIIFSASLKKSQSAKLKRKYITDLEKREIRDNYKDFLICAARQFIIRKPRQTEIIAGFPWFGVCGRDSFIALPGLTLAFDDVKTFKSVLDTQVNNLKNGLFSDYGTSKNIYGNSADTPLWFFWALQQYADYVEANADIWLKYKGVIKNILNGYKKGMANNIKLHENGLIYAGEPGKALTWMDGIVNGKPVTPRIGYVVEVNALWYNALLFCLELAKAGNDMSFIGTWKPVAEKANESFIEKFWNIDNNYLNDFVDEAVADDSIRPNQVIAASMKHTPLTMEMIKSIIDLATRELLTPRGLRTLSPQNPGYKGIYEGGPESRDEAYHQGTAFPWLLQHYCEAYLRLHKKSGISFVKGIYDDFENEMGHHGIGTISEIFDGDPPHLPRGAISQAWSVAALLRVERLVEQYSDEFLIE